MLIMKRVSKRNFKRCAKKSVIATPLFEDVISLLGYDINNLDKDSAKELYLKCSLLSGFGINKTMLSVHNDSCQRFLVENLKGIADLFNNLKLADPSCFEVFNKETTSSEFDSYLLNTCIKCVTTSVTNYFHSVKI